MSLSSCAPRFIFHTASHIKSILQMSLFSAVVAALLSVTVLDIKQDSQDTSASYLENTYELQVLANSNGSHPFTPAQPSQFSAPKYAIWVNTLLLMSLCLKIFLHFWLCRYGDMYLITSCSLGRRSSAPTTERGCGKFLPANGKIRWCRLH